MLRKSIRGSKMKSRRHLFNEVAQPSRAVRIIEDNCFCTWFSAPIRLSDISLKGSENQGLKQEKRRLFCKYFADNQIDK